MVCRTSALLIVVTTGLSGLTGCDTVRTIQHSVTMEVTDVRGAPASDVEVSMKESWESWQTWGGGPLGADEQYSREKWQRLPWLQGMTNAEGKAVICIEISAMDSTKGDTPPPSRDFVSNREQIIKLEGQDGQDEIRLVLKPGAVAAGKWYTVKIEEIEKPRYVDGRNEDVLGKPPVHAVYCRLNVLGRK